MARRMNQLGMTLTEIIVVTFIMVMLAGLAVPNYFRTVEEARANEARANLSSIHFAQRVFRENNPNRRYYPDPFGTVTTQSNLADIESNLRVGLNTQFYDISITTSAMYPFLAVATRNNPSIDRQYCVQEDGIVSEC
jgi:type II secretory pathway pseudopilin PulG